MNKKWIFLRGLSRGNFHWAKFPEVFKHICTDAEIEFLEIPGNGFSSNERSPIAPEKIVQLLKSRSSFCKEGMPFNLCGISLGGMIALKWCELYPENISSVSIINSSLRQCSKLSERLVPQNYSKILQALFMNDAYEQEKRILEITSNKFTETSINLDMFGRLSSLHRVSKINFARQLLLASKIHINHLNNIPLKVISSENDRLVDSSCSKAIAELFQGQQFTHQTAGHDIALDEPEWLSAVLLDKGRSS
jgi:pimeloyl-ACP methyl ester carboxylesterase